MHHGKHFRRLNKKWSHRVAMLRNMATSLILQGRIKTTLPKAKELRRVAEKMVTYAKRQDDKGKELARAFLREHPESLPKLYELAERFKTRPGGYTRIWKFGNRYGDNAPMAIIEYIDGPQDLKYNIFLKSLAYKQLQRENKVPSPVENDKLNLNKKMTKDEFKKVMRRNQSESKFQHKLNKVMVGKNITREELNEDIDKEMERIISLMKDTNIGLYGAKPVTADGK
ncbi:54S ribosomal protein L8, mitochondrial [Basidiobolus ranarum]|uniref:54S ribosomal protein L8, mitochondrial n=1 Tax=Basidiobolus ranarum TaxID=34480 RepID=A0ABR2WVV1_9FUNG